MPIPALEPELPSTETSAVPNGPAATRYLGRRALALLLDFLVLYATTVATMLVLSFGYIWAKHGGNMAILPEVVASDASRRYGNVVHVIYFFSYFTIAHWYFGRTFGKWCLSLRVLGVDGHDLSFGRSLGRTAGYVVSGQLLLGLGYAFAYFRRDRRALHDLIAATTVLHESERAPAVAAPPVHEAQRAA
jgi:uncharacterized RDD family membrane protein YckC